MPSIVMQVGVAMGGVSRHSRVKDGGGADSNITSSTSRTSGGVSNGAELHIPGVRHGPVGGANNSQTIKGVTMGNHKHNNIVKMVIIRDIPKMVGHLKLLSNRGGLEVQEHRHFKSYSLQVLWVTRMLMTGVPPLAGNTNLVVMKENRIASDQGRTCSHMTNKGSHMTSNGSHMTSNGSHMISKGSHMSYTHL